MKKINHTYRLLLVSLLLLIYAQSTFEAFVLESLHIVDHLVDDWQSFHQHSLHAHDHSHDHHHHHHIQKKSEQDDTTKVPIVKPKKKKDFQSEMLTFSVFSDLIPEADFFYTFHLSAPFIASISPPPRPTHLHIT
ncbi:MAG: hypothetical protein MRY78_10985 [Saprospiraceae bacterium]|nr:hypothetical protein [Saprospiraceae bacterium]